jgi:hypothetical protein
MTRVVGCGAAWIVALTASLAAQNPPSQPRPKPTPNPTSPTYPQPAPSRPAAESQAPMVTVEGCLYREVEVPGRAIPEADWQRVNTDNDYVLADTRVVKGSAPAVTAKSGPAATGTSGTAAKSILFKVDTADDARLKLADNAGRRVQIDGRLEHLDRASYEISPAIDLVELKGTALRQVGGECPKPQTRSQSR